MKTLKEYLMNSKLAKLIRQVARHRGLPKEAEKMLKKDTENRLALLGLDTAEGRRSLREELEAILRLPPDAGREG
jgi:hypothetical protein